MMNYNLAGVDTVFMMMPRRNTHVSAHQWGELPQSQADVCRRAGPPISDVEAPPAPPVARFLNRADLSTVRRPSAIVTSVASDSHTWNLVFLQLLLEELGCSVVNLGPCVPDDFLVSECVRINSDFVVISTVNGHGYNDGIRVISQIRSLPELANTPIVIGGKLGVSGELLPAKASSLIQEGFDAVFDDSTGLDPFTSFVRELSSRAVP